MSGHLEKVFKFKSYSTPLAIIHPKLTRVSEDVAGRSFRKKVQVSVTILGIGFLGEMDGKEEPVGVNDGGYREEE